ncbi:MAG: GlsB/YeaQ/YmgE family stress response membrane protein [Candidatus Limnocylindrales bacterium]
MGIFAWIVVGAVAGLIATLIMGGRTGLVMTLGLLMTVAIGIAGGLLGGWVATNVFHYGSMDGINIESIIIAIAGALVLIVTWRALTSRRQSRIHL